MAKAAGFKPSSVVTRSPKRVSMGPINGFKPRSYRAFASASAVTLALMLENVYDVDVRCGLTLKLAPGQILWRPPPEKRNNTKQNSLR